MSDQILQQLKLDPEFMQLSQADKNTVYADVFARDVEDDDEFQGLEQSSKREVTRGFIDYANGFDPAGFEAPEQEYEPAFTMPDDAVSEEDETGRTFGNVASDVLIALTSGAIDIPRLVMGLADIPTAGRAGYLVEKLGFKPDEAQAVLDSWYSEAQKEAQGKVFSAEGFIDTVKEAIKTQAS